jgi:hypothetical protein
LGAVSMVGLCEGECAMDRRQVLKGAGGMALAMSAMDATAQDGVGPETVYELRTYHLNEGKQALILERFRTKERAIFVRHGMHPVAYWVPTDEPLAGRTLIYIVRHKSRAAATESWKGFSADPEWVALKTETEKDGTFVVSQEHTFMTLTDFSEKV